MATLVARIGDLATSIASWVEKLRSATIVAVVDGGGVAITTGSKLTIQVPFACTIIDWTLVADQTGSIVIDIKKATYSGFPTTSSITASAKPTLSSARKNTSSTLTGWTTTITAGDVLEFNVDSITTCQRAVLQIKVKRT